MVAATRVARLDGRATLGQALAVVVGRRGIEHRAVPAVTTGGHRHARLERRDVTLNILVDALLHLRHGCLITAQLGRRGTSHPQPRSIAFTVNRDAIIEGDTVTLIPLTVGLQIVPASPIVSDVSCLPCLHAAIALDHLGVGGIASLLIEAPTPAITVHLLPPRLMLNVKCLAV